MVDILNTFYFNRSYLKIFDTDNCVSYTCILGLQKYQIL